MTGPVSKRILILDDDNEVRKLSGILLSAEGHHVTQVACGREAVSLHRETPFDLVIIELFMGSYNGFEAYAELRRTMPPPPFIITANSVPAPAEDYLKVAKRLGARETLAKPFTADQLLAAVRNIFNAGN
jgi:CheY-like chemotaxis protein